jgi:hypothetical protein
VALPGRAGPQSGREVNLVGSTLCINAHSSVIKVADPGGLDKRLSTS